MSESYMNRMISWGQYVHWASIQHELYSQISKEDCHYSRTIGAISHWLASQYVVIEGWNELKETDDSIDELLSKYPDHELILKRCRNAVYHYQNKILDKRIQAALAEEDMLIWASALQDEFERYLFLYPVKSYGMSIEAMDLRDEYFGCIGWKPVENVWVKWFELYEICSNYVRNNSLNELEISRENDLVIEKTFHSLMEAEPLYLRSRLSRLNEHT